MREQNSYLRRSGDEELGASVVKLRIGRDSGVNSPYEAIIEPHYGMQISLKVAPLPNY
jgi:hypothetical protein